jgi:hypothetical protein
MLTLGGRPQPATLASEDGRATALCVSTGAGRARREFTAAMSRRPAGRRPLRAGAGSEAEAVGGGDARAVPVQAVAARAGGARGAGAGAAWAAAAAGAAAGCEAALPSRGGGSVAARAGWMPAVPHPPRAHPRRGRGGAERSG